ncbi:hypothetical protein F4777DRAFT_267050 [Nemania sp. FL0916]|nr:hypothetical protein F4777DRAFT_267050 [Nemania sp. FL0916]
MRLEYVKANGEIIVAPRAITEGNLPTAGEATSTLAVAGGSQPTAGVGRNNGSHQPGANSTDNNQGGYNKRETSSQRLTRSQRRKAKREAKRQAQQAEPARPTPRTPSPSPPPLTAAEYPPLPASAPPKMEGTVRKFPSISVAFLAKRARDKLQAQAARAAVLGTDKATQSGTATARNDKGKQADAGAGKRPGDRPGWDKRYPGGQLTGG